MNRKSIVFTITAFSLVVLSVAAAQYHKNTSQSKLVRNIASISSDFSFNLQESSISKQVKIREELSLNCGSLSDESMTLAESSQVVMLKFKKCDQLTNKKAVAYSIKNMTNGYQGQIFHDQVNSKSKFIASHFSTDYIQLEAGQNILELQISLNDGQKINKKIKINRLN